MSGIDFEGLWASVAARFPGPRGSVHGPDHWRRVERNGLLLAGRSRADVVVVRLFALFHDCRRVNDGWDHGHGARGAAFATTLRGAAFALDDARFALFEEACVDHTAGRRHGDPTIGTCWDADRLDLGRVGIVPAPDYMSTAFAREIASGGELERRLGRED